MAALVVSVCKAAPSPVPYIGSWLLEGPSGFDLLVIKPNGHCEWTGGEYDGGAFIGAYCSYTVKRNVITIVDTWDNSRERKKLSTPVVLRYMRNTDFLRIEGASQQAEFHRTPKTPEEIYESKRQ